MQRQPDQPRPSPAGHRAVTTRRIRLTDQALVAVNVARQFAADRATGDDLSAPQVVIIDLLLGLATETEGVAGPLLRATPNAVAGLQARALSQDVATRAATPEMAVALRWAADSAADHPLWTVDLLHAVCEVGGSALNDLLEDVGLRRAQLMETTGGYHRVDRVTETYGLGRDDSGVADLSPDAASAVARAHARGGGAIALLFALAEQSRAGQLPLDADRLKDRLDAMGPPSDTDGTRWDAGVDNIIQTAKVLRLDSEPLNPLDLLRACAVAGGQGPQRLLAPG